MRFRREATDSKRPRPPPGGGVAAVRGARLPGVGGVGDVGAFADLEVEDHLQLGVPGYLGRAGGTVPGWWPAPGAGNRVFERVPLELADGTAAGADAEPCLAVGGAAGQRRGTGPAFRAGLGRLQPVQVVGSNSGLTRLASWLGLAV